MQPRRPATYTIRGRRRQPRGLPRGRALPAPAAYISSANAAARRPKQLRSLHHSSIITRRAARKLACHVDEEDGGVGGGGGAPAGGGGGGVAGGGGGEGVPAPERGVQRRLRVRPQLRAGVPAGRMGWWQLRWLQAPVQVRQAVLANY
ncbi:hypothetical protein HU200_056191 [Digitaria exilis]|uniref:Uncharacterized protein n=1 Tax=Digitaria exilis TaxID=1010633 RepID=A0A835AHW4_9POAL|nr:hypothetical protein HU200_056191 [Digitaria exilis]